MAVKNDINNLIVSLNERLSKHLDIYAIHTVENELGRIGVREKYWRRPDNWEDYLKGAENPDKPDDDAEFQVRKGNVLFCMAESIIKHWLHAGVYVSNSKWGKQTELDSIVAYQAAYKEKREVEFYDETGTKAAIKVLKDQIDNWVEPPYDASWQFDFIDLEGEIYKRIKDYTRSSHRKDVKKALDDFGIKEGKFTTGTWQDWIKTSATEKDWDDNLKWLWEKAVPQVILNYCSDKGNAETNVDKKKRYWNFAIGYWEKYKPKIFTKVDNFNALKKLRKDAYPVAPETDLAKLRNGVKAFLEGRMKELYDGTPELTNLEAEINKWGRTDFTASFKAGDTWKTWVDGGASDTEILTRKGEILLYISKYLITTTKDKVNTAATKELALSYFNKMTDYLEGDGRSWEQGTWEALQSYMTDYEEAEKKIIEILNKSKTLLMGNMSISKNIKTNTNESRKWALIDTSFTDILIADWKTAGFDFDSAQEWLGVVSKDALPVEIHNIDFFKWLKDNYDRRINKTTGTRIAPTPDWLQNRGDWEEMKKEFAKFIELTAPTSPKPEERIEFLPKERLEHHIYKPNPKGDPVLQLIPYDYNRPETHTLAEWEGVLKVIDVGQKTAIENRLKKAWETHSYPGGRGPAGDEGYIDTTSRSTYSKEFGGGGEVYNLVKKEYSIFELKQILADILDEIVKETWIKDQEAKHNIHLLWRYRYLLNPNQVLGQLKNHRFIEWGESALRN